MIGLQLINEYMTLIRNPVEFLDRCYEDCIKWVEVGPEDESEPYYTIFEFNDGSAITANYENLRFRYTDTVQHAMNILIELEELTLIPEDLH